VDENTVLVDVSKVSRKKPETKENLPPKQPANQTVNPWMNVEKDKDVVKDTELEKQGKKKEENQEVDRPRHC